MILSQATNGNTEYEIYDIGNNAISAGYLPAKSGPLAVCRPRRASPLARIAVQRLANEVPAAQAQRGSRSRLFARAPSYRWLVVGTVCIGAFMDASLGSGWALMQRWRASSRRLLTTLWRVRVPAHHGGGTPPLHVTRQPPSPGRRRCAEVQPVLVRQDARALARARIAG